MAKFVPSIEVSREALAKELTKLKITDETPPANDGNASQSTIADGSGEDESIEASPSNATSSGSGNEVIPNASGHHSSSNTHQSFTSTNNNSREYVSSEHRREVNTANARKPRKRFDELGPKQQENLSS